MRQIFFRRIFRLVEKHNFRGKDRNARFGSKIRERAGNRLIPSIYPKVLPALVEEELQLMLAAIRVYLVNWQFEPFSRFPADQHSRRCLFPLPVCEMSAQFELILSKDGDVYILMIPALAAEEQINRPTSAAKPGSPK